MKNRRHMLMPTLGNQRGSGLVELLLVLTLLALLGATLLTLMFSGMKTYQRIDSKRSAEAEARVALSYLTIRLHQGDVAGGVEILTGGDIPGGKAIALTDYAQDSSCTWIYFTDGKLYECMMGEGLIPTDHDGFVIAHLDDLILDYNPLDSTLHSVVAYTDDAGSVGSLSATVALRRDPDW